MKNNFPHCFRISFILLIFSVAISCDFITNRDASTDKLLVKASNNLKKHPDSTLKIVDKILVLSTKNAIDDEKQLALYQLKQRAFLKLQKMDSVHVTGEKIREIASRIPDSLAIAESLIPLFGDVDYNYLKTAKKYIPGAIHSFEKNKKYYEQGMVTALNGMVLGNEGDFMKSQDYFLKALKIFEALDSLKAVGKVYNSLGINFASAKILDKSTFYYHKALRIAEIRKDSARQASVLLNIGINVKTTNPEQAIRIYNRAIELRPKNNGEIFRMKVEYNLANIYYDQQNFNKAEAIYKKILAISTKTNYQTGIVMTSAGLGNIYSAKNQFPLAISYYKSALETLKATNQNNVIVELLPDIVEVYKKAGDIKNALYYSDELLKLTNAMFALEKTKSTLELEKKYQTEKKEIEIKNLGAISNLRLFMLYGLSFFVIILFFVLRKQKKLYREKQHSYALLMQQYKLERLEKSDKKDTILVDTSTTAAAVTKEDQCLFAKLTEYYENEKPYLNSKLKASEIARILQVPQRNISAILKVNGYSSFNNFNNKYRIEEAKKIFEDPNSEILKMEVIASQSGFGSKQSFYSAFEEYTGLNPGFYRAEILK